MSERPSASENGRPAETDRPVRTAEMLGKGRPYQGEQA